jgi:hypothetical protein
MKWRKKIVSTFGSASARPPLALRRRSHRVTLFEVDSHRTILQFYSIPSAPVATLFCHIHPAPLPSHTRSLLRRRRQSPSLRPSAVEDASSGRRRTIAITTIPTLSFPRLNHPARALRLRRSPPQIPHPGHGCRTQPPPPRAHHGRPYRPPPRTPRPVDADIARGGCRPSSSDLASTCILSPPPCRAASGRRTPTHPGDLPET